MTKLVNYKLLKVIINIRGLTQVIFNVVIKYNSILEFIISN